MKEIFLAIAILFSIQHQIIAQKTDTLIMNGTLSVHKAASFKYKIVVGSHSGKWDGYSILDEEGPNETKSSVSVQFIKGKSAMAFAEKTLISTKSKEKSFCFVGGLLKMNDKKSQVKGFFLGQDDKKKMCGSGSVKLNLPEKAIILMTPDGTKDTNISAIVTSKKSETFEVKNGEVQLEVWDGGITDQDSLSVSLNGVVIEAAFQIAAEKKMIPIKLKKGENIIKIKALNEGSQAPNSARILLIDQGSKFPVVSFLRKDEEATLKIKW